MCSIESVRPSSSSSSLSSSNKLLNGKISLNMIEKRLKHLREELRNLTKRELTYATSNLLMEQDINENDDHNVQYKKRLNQLSRLHDKQVTNLNLWHFYRTHTIEQMYKHEVRQSDETFQMKKIDFKSKLISKFNDKRRYLDYEHQNVNIRYRSLSNNDQFMFSRMNDINDVIPSDGQNHHSNESIQQQQQQQRPTYNLRRAVVNDLNSENALTTPAASLKDLSIFSRSNSLLPPFGGIELQRCLSSNDIEQDIANVQKDLCHIETIKEKTKIDDLSTKKSLIDVRIEDGRLWYQRSWFSRNSPILLVFDDLEMVPALVLTVGRNDLLIRRSGTNIKHRVSLSLLHDGHLAIRKRNCMF